MNNGCEGWSSYAKNLTFAFHVISELCEWCGVMRGGELVDMARTDSFSVTTRKLNSYTESLLAASASYFTEKGVQGARQ